MSSSDIIKLVESIKLERRKRFDRIIPPKDWQLRQDLHINTAEKILYRQNVDLSKMSEEEANRRIHSCLINTMGLVFVKDYGYMTPFDYERFM